MLGATNSAGWVPTDGKAGAGEGSGALTHPRLGVSWPEVAKTARPRLLAVGPTVARR